MQLLIVRHGRAMERADFQSQYPGRLDQERPLTNDGIQKLMKTRDALPTLVSKLEIYASSPLVRAQQTWTITRELFPTAEYQEWSELTPSEHPDRTLKKLSELHKSGVRSAGIVGHEPHLSKLISFAVSGQLQFRYELKKGGVAGLLWEGQPKPGEAVLQFLLTPKHLRSIARD